MAYNVAALNKLIGQFEKLPGVGKKSAQRMAFYMLSLTEGESKEFADAIIDAKASVRKCKICQSFTDTEICSVCSDATRDKSIICVVENPQDLLAFEKTREYKGTYHVLHGLISPMDGIGPDQIHIKELLARLADDEVKEIVMATNPTVEGEATAMYLSKLIKPLDKTVTRLAYGIPVGGNLEYADEVTLYRALEGRSKL